MFVKRLKSDYRNEWSFRTVYVDQRGALCLVDDVDWRRSCEEEVYMLRPGLMSDNPLHMDDFFLAGIETILGV